MLLLLFEGVIGAGHLLPFNSVLSILVPVLEMAEHFWGFFFIGGWVGKEEEIGLIGGIDLVVMGIMEFSITSEILVPYRHEPNREGKKRETVWEYW